MTFSLTIDSYDLIYDESLYLVKAWKNNSRVKVTQALNDEFWELYEEDIRRAAEQQIAPEFEGVDYYDQIPTRHK